MLVAREGSSERGGDECMGFAFGRCQDSYGPVGTCCLLIKCKRAASLSLDSPAHPPLASLAALVLSCPPFVPLPIQEPEAALVSLRNQPRADNNEIHKSVREHAEHPVQGLLPFLCPSLVFSLATPRTYPRAATFPALRAFAFVTLD